MGHVPEHEEQGMSWTFTPPTVKRYVSTSARDFLYSRVSYQEGVTVVKTVTGGYRQEQLHDTNKTDIAVVYLGGHIYPVSAAEAASLTTAGYGAYLTETV